MNTNTNPQSPNWACIDACLACANACDRCAAGCLAEDSVKMLGRCITLDTDCAAVCRVAASAMLRRSPAVPSLCRACVEVCEQCAQECQHHAMSHCQECAQACIQCAKECRSMTTTGASASAR